MQPQGHLVGDNYRVAIAALFEDAHIEGKQFHDTVTGYFRGVGVAHLSRAGTSSGHSHDAAARVRGRRRRGAKRTDAQRFDSLWHDFRRRRQ